MGNASNTPQNTQPEQATEVRDDAEAMDIVVETFDPRPSTVEAAEHPGVAEQGQTGREDDSQPTGGGQG